MKRLNDMTMQELIDELGGFGLRPSDLMCIRIDNEDKEYNDELYEIYKKMGEENYENKDKIDIIKKFVIKNSKNIDKEKFLLVQLYIYKEGLKSIKGINSYKRATLENQIKSCEKILKENNSKKSVIMTDSDDGWKEEIEIINLERLTSKAKNNNKNKKKIEELEKIVDLKILLGNLEASDLDVVYNIENLGGEIEAAAQIKTVLENEEGIDISKITAKEICEIIQKNYKREYLEKLEQTVLKYSEFMNIDKFLLVSSHRILENIEAEKIDKKSVPIYREILEKMYKHIENDKSKLKITICEYKDDEMIPYGEINFKKADLKEELENFQTDVYVGKERRENIREEIFDQDKSLNEYTLFEIECLKLTEKEIKELLEKTENIEFLITHNMISQKNIQYLLETRQEWQSEIIEILYKNETLEKGDILKLYIEGKFNLDNIRFLKENIGEEINDIISVNELVNKYNQYKNDKEKDENKKELERYALLYRELIIRGGTKEETTQIGENIIEELNEKFEESDLKELYKLGVINIETAIEWGGESITKDMFFDKMLKPSDVKMLLAEEKIDINYIINILKSRKLTEEEKLTLICSTFSDDNQVEIRMELMQYLDFDEEQLKKDYKGEERKIRERKQQGEKRKKYTIDPGARWKLMTLLDDKYTQELCADGHIIFELPNVENGVVIIEKMFRKTKEGTKPSYGNATYIIEEEKFITNKNKIIQEDSKGVKKINRDILLEMRENSETDKIVHSKTWGNSIKRYFNIEEESRYTDKQKELIDNAIKSIEKSRILE